MSEGGASIRDLTRFWRSAAPVQRIGLAAFAIACIGLLALVGNLARRPQYAVLYANLDQQDAAEIVQHLRDMKVPYHVTGAGTIEAPADSVPELRLDLAAESLPAGGQTGFELLDRSRLGLTDFGEHLNYQRALQGELARTISHLDPVEEARVHLALPAESLYTSEQKKPTASVVLKLGGGQSLSSAQVRSIIHLVSGAVEGLDPESVAVLDTRGRLLSNPDESGPGAGLAAASNQLQLRREFEREMETAVQSMLDGVLGPGKSVVRASAQLTFDQVERERETYEPAADGTGVVESRQESRETYRGLADPGAVGIPGVSANTGAGGGAPASSTARRAEADQYDHTETTARYLVSRQKEHTVQPPGRVQQISLSVFVDDQADLGEVKDLSQAVSAAAGLDPARGDTVVITRIPFQEAAPEDAGSSKVDAVRGFYFRVGRDFAAFLLTFMFLRFLLAALRRRTAEAPEPAPRTLAPSLATGPQSAPPPPPPPDLQIDPDRAAAVLRGWLSSDSPPGGNGGLADRGPAAAPQ